MKRHSRPYGCTFVTCKKTFGSKNDWKRHENSQHFHLETWRCDEERPEGGACAKVCYRKQTFQDHLKKEHGKSDAQYINLKTEICHMGRNCQARFWCGFCKGLIELKKRGLEAWAERFDHIDDHFMGRKGFTAQRILDWIPVDSNEPQGEKECLNPVQASSGKMRENSSDSSSFESSSEGTPKAIGSSSTLGAIDKARHGHAKRKRPNSDRESPKPTKIAKNAKKQDTVVFCVK
jgi:hypothetical protein